MFAVFSKAEGCVARSGEGEQHTLSGSTEAPRSRSGSFSFLSCSLTLILIVMGVSCVTAPLLCWKAIVGVCGMRAGVLSWCRLMAYDEAVDNCLTYLLSKQRRQRNVKSCCCRRPWREYLLRSTCVMQR